MKERKTRQVDSNRFGFTEQHWEEGKAEIISILRRVASKRGMISYGDLSSELTTIDIAPHDLAMSSILGQISKAEDARGHGMLSVIVVHKIGDMEPGKGFYECAAELGRDVSDRVRLWVSELHKVHNTWAN